MCSSVLEVISDNKFNNYNADGLQSMSKGAPKSGTVQGHNDQRLIQESTALPGHIPRVIQAAFGTTKYVHPIQTVEKCNGNV